MCVRVWFYARIMCLRIRCYARATPCPALSTRMVLRVYGVLRYGVVAYDVWNWEVRRGGIRCVVLKSAYGGTVGASGAAGTGGEAYARARKSAVVTPVQEQNNGRWRQQSDQGQLETAKANVQQECGCLYVWFLCACVDISTRLPIA